jgi:glutaredoxin
MFKVYGKTNCPSCTTAKQLLEKKGINYQYLSFGVDYDFGKMLSINSKHKTMPMITVVESGVESYVGGLKEIQEILSSDSM